MQRPFWFAFPLCIISFTPPSAATAELPRVRVAEDGRSFVRGDDREPFRVWGFNYDHDRDGRLLEDYWTDEWETVVADFREMKELGANTVRIHLQFGRFMEAADRPNQDSLTQLRKLLELAEETGLYLDLTGLGCYHKQDVPPWYDAMNETERWAAQTRFWEAIAATCAESSAVFFYDLMNEPVSPGGDQPADDWLGPPFGDKHFVQRISLDRAGRERPEIARAWIAELAAAIRKHDRRHLVTVGLVPWSLDRPGLTSGFVPEKIAPELDFLCVHIYPESGRLDEALDTLKGFNVGKPVVIEEIFALQCNTEELGRFMDQADAHCAGYIGFYWGATPDELKTEGTIAAAITAAWLEFFQQRSPN
jgi:hypothetical protein